MHEKAIQLVEQATTALQQLAELLQKRYQEEAKCSTDREVTPDMFPPVSQLQTEEIARRMKVFWDGFFLDPLLRVGKCEIDLTTAQGRFEVLVLAVLMGARVSRQVTEQTFEILKCEGLLQQDLLVDATAQTISRIETVIRKHYRALTSKTAKIDAIVWNAAHLHQHWQGDLHLIYETLKGDSKSMLQALRQFRQISRMALWICRIMHAHGIWKDIEPRLTWYIDRTSNLPLLRLGYLSGDGDMPPSSDTETIIQDRFDGDILPLYLQGSVLCRLNDIDTCLSRCPVASWCTYPTARSSSGSVQSE